MKYFRFLFLTLILAASSVQSYDSEPYRLLSNKDYEGWTVETDDGTIWRAVDSTSANRVKYWRTNDRLVIRPVYLSNWYKAKFYLSNERDRTNALVELSQGPLLNRATNNQITYIDHLSGQLKTEDGAGRCLFWNVSYQDREPFQDWHPNHSIIIGSNRNCWAGWFSNEPYILINFEKNTFVHANLD
jgi:hypothetical protein